MIMVRYNIELFRYCIDAPEEKMRITSIYICAMLLVGFVATASYATGTQSIEVSREEKISVNVENGNLNDMLRIMSEKKLFEIKGPVPGSESLTLNFTNLSLEEALKKIMRGYNYVLIRQGESRRPLLVVMGKAERSKYADQPAQPPAQTASQPQSPGAGRPATQAADASQPADPRSYVPPSTLPQAPPTPPPPRPSRTPAAANVAGPAGRAPGPPSAGIAASPDQKGQQQQEQQVQDKKPGAGQELQPPPKPVQPEPQGWPRMSGVSTRDVFAPLMLQ